MATWLRKNITMNKPAQPTATVPIHYLMDIFRQYRTEAENNRDQITLDAPEHSQNNWQFFNGQVRAIDSIESHLRLYLSTLNPETPPEPDKLVEQVEPGLLVVKFSNGSHLTLEEGDNELALYDGMPGEGAWMGTITKDGILCSPNSGSSCADLVLELKEHL